MILTVITVLYVLVGLVVGWFAGRESWRNSEGLLASLFLVMVAMLMWPFFLLVLLVECDEKNGKHGSHTRRFGDFIFGVKR